VNLPTLPMTREEFWRQYWDRIDAGGDVTMDLPEPHPERCWIWTGATNAKGYGTTQVQGKTWLTHRLAYEVFNGELESGMVVLHSCNTPPCCNPRHLSLGTPRRNWDEMLEDFDLPQPVTDYMEGRPLGLVHRRLTQRVTPGGW
jgi:hypothetical protein